MPCTNHGETCNGAECRNPNADNGMMTKVWGPAGWLFLHCVAAGYPNIIDTDNPEHIEKQNDYYRFFYYLGRCFHVSIVAILINNLLRIIHQLVIWVLELVYVNGCMIFIIWLMIN